MLPASDTLPKQVVPHSTLCDSLLTQGRENSLAPAKREGLLAVFYDCKLCLSRASTHRSASDLMSLRYNTIGD